MTNRKHIELTSGELFVDCFINPSSKDEGMVEIYIPMEDGSFQIAYFNCSSIIKLASEIVVSLNEFKEKQSINVKS